MTALDKRHRVASGLLVAIVGLSMGSEAWALRPEVLRARELYSDLHYDQAQQAFLDALALENNQPDDVAMIYLHLGILEGAQNDEATAEEHFRRALEVDPNVALPAGLPPKITEPFDRAREFLGGEHLRVVHSAPEQWTEGEPSSLRFEVTGDLMRMVSGARLQLWLRSTAGDEGAIRTYTQAGSGPFDFSIPPALIAPGDEVCYRVEFLGAAASVLARIDDTDELHVVVVESSAPRSLQSGDSSGTASRQPQAGSTEPRALHRRWWLWTIIGVVVAGAVVGVTVGVTTGDDGVEFGRPVVVR